MFKAKKELIYKYMVKMGKGEKMVITQEEVDKLPLISLEEFNLKVEEQKKNNWVIKRLINDLGSWENFTPHLIRDLFSRIGARPQINKY